MIGIVSLVEHLHGRTSDYGIHVSGPMVEVALLLSVGVKDGIYRYRLFFLEQSQDGLHGSVAHAKLLRKEGDTFINPSFPCILIQLAMMESRSRREWACASPTKALCRPCRLSHTRSYDGSWACRSL